MGPWVQGPGVGLRQGRSPPSTRGRKQEAAKQAGGGFGVSGDRTAGLLGSPEARGAASQVTSCTEQHGPCLLGPHQATPGPMHHCVRRTRALHVTLQFLHKAAQRTQNPKVLWDPKVKSFWLQCQKSQLFASARQGRLPRVLTGTVC